MMREYMTVPIEWKSIDETNVLEGKASTFGNVDLGGDVVERGAFKKTISERIPTGQVKLLADHIPTTDKVLGTVFYGEEKGNDFIIRAKISAAPSAQDFKIKAMEGHVNTLSIGYEAIKAPIDSKGIRHLQEVKLYEVSAVVFPMNTQATITHVKSLATELSQDEREKLFADLADLANWPVEDLTEEKTGEPVEETSPAPVEEKDTHPVESVPSESAGTEPSEASASTVSLSAKLAHADAVLEGRETEGAADPRTLGRITALFDVMDQWLEESHEG